MGVSTEQWRSSIGLYCGPSIRVKEAVCSTVDLTWIHSCLKLIVILALLMIGCVEPHPGPAVLELFCRRCPFKTASASNYVNHQAIHTLEKRFQLLCPLCSFQASGKRSLEVHICAQHTPRKEVRTVQVASASTSARCNKLSCDFSAATTKDLAAHLKQHLKNNEEINCPFGSCTKADKPKTWVVTFSKLANFNTHLNNYHKKLMKEELPYSDLLQTVSLATTHDVSFESSCEESSADNVDQGPPEEPAQDPPPDEEMFTMEQVCTYIAQFYLKMEAQLNVPSSTVQEMCNNISNIVDFGHTIMKKTLIQALAGKVEPEEAEKIAFITFSQDPLFRVHNKNFSSVCLLTEYRRYLYYKKNFNFKEPIRKHIHVSPMNQQPTLAQRLPGQQQPVPGQQPVPQPQAPTSEKNKTVIIVPIKESLLTQLQDPDVQKEVDASLLKLASGFYQTERQAYSDFTDGEVFRKHPASKKPCLFLNFACDAFGITNPIGAAKNKHKTVGLYYVLGNLPPEKRSKVDVLQLSALFLEEHLKVESKGKKARAEKKLRWDQCLQPVIDQMIELCQDGIEYKGQKLPVYFMLMLGDNLGQHQIGGFSESFVGEFWCRYCDITDQEFRRSPHLVKSFRTPDEYAECVRKIPTIAAATNATTFKGIKFDSILNTLPGFHVCLPALAPCLAHDLFEGVVANDMMLFIKKFINLKWFTRISLNSKIKAFKFVGNDATNRPTTITLNNKKRMKRKLSGSASQNWAMMRFFPLILQDLVKDQNDPHWKAYLKLKSICQIVCAHTITEQDLTKLSALIRDYLQDRSTLFTEKLMCKHHYLAHYPSLIRLLGNPIRVWTLRMESHHQVMKRALRAANNFIDAPFTMAHKSQLKKAYVSLGRLFGDNFTYTMPRGFVPVWKPEISNYIKALKLPPNSVCPNTVCVHGTSYSRGMWLLLNQEEGILVVGRIVAIFCHGDVQFVIEKRSTTFDGDGLGLHPIHIEDDRGLCHISSPKEISDYMPLNAYQFQGKMCLALKYKPLAIILPEETVMEK